MDGVLTPFGSEEQKQAYLVPSIRGEKLSCLGITEPGAGSDRRKQPLMTSGA